MPKTTTRPITAPAPALPDQGEDVRRFLATIAPDPELDRLAAALGEAAGHAAELRERAADVERRRAALRDALTVATNAERQNLYPALAMAAAEAGSLPNLLADAAGRLATAELRYLARIHRLATVEARRRAAALAPFVDRLEEIHRKTIRDDSRRAGGPLFAPAERAAMQAERSRIWTESASLREAFQAADFVAGLVAARMRQRGDDVRPDGAGWERAAERAARGDAMAA